MTTIQLHDSKHERVDSESNLDSEPVVPVMAPDATNLPCTVLTAGGLADTDAAGADGAFLEVL
jgi:hypothetical protein